MFRILMYFCLFFGRNRVSDCMAIVGNSLFYHHRFVHTGMVTEAPYAEPMLIPSFFFFWGGGHLKHK